MAVNTQPQLLSGARGLIKSTAGDGSQKTLAVALDISVNVRETVRETYVMGELNPMGLDPTAIDVDCSIGRVVPVNRVDAAETDGTLKGDAPGSASNPHTASESNGKASAASALQLNLEKVIAEILSVDTIDIDLFDKITGKQIASVKHARFAGRTISTGAGDVASERLNFVGIYDAGYDNENSAEKIGYES